LAAALDVRDLRQSVHLLAVVRLAEGMVAVCFLRHRTAQLLVERGTRVLLPHTEHRGLVDADSRCREAGKLDRLGAVPLLLHEIAQADVVLGEARVEPIIELAQRVVLCRDSLAHQHRRNGALLAHALVERVAAPGLGIDPGVHVARAETEQVAVLGDELEPEGRTGLDHPGIAAADLARTDVDRVLGSGHRLHSSARMRAGLEHDRAHSELDQRQGCVEAGQAATDDDDVALLLSQSAASQHGQRSGCGHKVAARKLERLQH